MIAQSIKEQCFLVVLGRVKGGFCEVWVSEDDKHSTWDLLLKKDLQARLMDGMRKRATLNQQQ